MSLEHKLTVRTADPLAEVTVYDASFNRVGRDVGHYDGVHRNGLYEIRVRTAGTQEEKLISLAKDETLNIGPVAFSSPIPLTDTITSDEAHRAAVIHASQNPVPLGIGSGLIITVRDRLGSEPPVARGSPATGLSLVGPDGKTVFDLGLKAPVDPSGRSPVAAIFLHVNAGVYRLRLDPPDGTPRERTLVASSAWTTSCFMVRRPFRGQPVADLAQGSLSLNRLGQSFAPDDARARLSEAARDALANNRQVTAAAAQALMNEKFDDPMLGLLVAHLLLRDTPKDPILDTVISNLTRLLGHTHPDVQALAVATSQPSMPATVTEMPMLRASWDAIVTRTVSQPSLIPPDSLAARVSSRILPGVPWLVWEAPDASTAYRADFKMAALRSYVGQVTKSRSDTPSTEAPQASFQDSFSVPRVPLDTEDREELTRNLGVPSSVLDAMLSRLND